MALSAKESLELALSHLDRVQVAVWDPVDWSDIGNYGLYALEAAVVAAAESLGIEAKPSHWSKSEAAVTLAEEHDLPDITSLMRDLNDARKASNYGDVARPEHLDAEDVAVKVEEFVAKVAAIVNATETDDGVDQV